MKKELVIGSLPCLVIIVLVIYQGAKYNNRVQTIAAPTQQQEFSLATVQQHHSAADCWQAIDGKVYDVTTFVDQHPGGKSLVKYCGQDASQAFATIKKGQGHSDEARKLLPNYYLGILK